MPLSKEIINYLKSKKCTRFMLHNCNIWDKDIEDIIQLLHERPDIKYVDLSWNNISDISAEKLAMLTTITELDVSKTDIGDNGALKLVSNPHIKILNLSHNDISDSENNLAKHTKQIELTLKHTSIKSETLEEIIKKVETNKMSQIIEEKKENLTISLSNPIKNESKNLASKFSVTLQKTPQVTEKPKKIKPYTNCKIM